jgi:hypothetical protein
MSTRRGHASVHERWNVPGYAERNGGGVSWGQAGVIHADLTGPAHHARLGAVLEGTAGPT